MRFEIELSVRYEIVMNVQHYDFKTAIGKIIESFVQNSHSRQRQ